MMVRMESRWYNIRANITVFLVIVIFIINSSAQFLLYSNQEVVAIALGQTLADIRWMIGASLLTSASTMIFWGYLGDKYSKKYVLIVSSIIWIAASYYIFFVTTFGGLFLGEILFGLGFGAVWPICYSLLGDIVKPESRGKTFSIVGLSLGLGLVIGLFLGSMFQSFWQYPFLIVSICGTIVVFIFFLVGTDLKRGGAEHELKSVLDEGAIYHYEISREHLKKIWKKPTNINLFVQGIPGMIPWAVLLIIVPIYFQTLGFDANTANLIAILSQGTNVAGSIFAGWYADRLAVRSQQKRLLYISLSILIAIPFFIGAFLLPYPTVPAGSGFDVFWGTALYPIGFILISIGSFFAPAAGVNWYAVIEDVNEPEVRSTIISFHALTDRIGNAIGPGLAAGLSVFFANLFGPQWGDPWALIIASLFWIPCAFFWLLSMKYIDKDVGEMKDLLKQRAKELEQNLERTNTSPI